MVWLQKQKQAKGCSISLSKNTFLNKLHKSKNTQMLNYAQNTKFIHQANRKKFINTKYSM